MKQGLGSGDPIGRQWAGVWVMRRLCWATWFEGQPKQSYPGAGGGRKKSAERAEIEGNRAVERSAFRQKNGTECDWMWQDIGVILLPPLACSKDSWPQPGEAWSLFPLPPRHCSRCLYCLCAPTFQEPSPARQSPRHVKQGAERYREKCQAP